MDDINLSSVNNNVIDVKITPSSTSLSVDGVVVFSGFHNKGFSDLHAPVVSLDHGILVQFD